MIDVLHKRLTTKDDTLESSWHRPCIHQGVRRFLLAQCLFLVSLGLVMNPARAELGAVETAIRFRGGLVWVDIQREGIKEPLHFLLDSGASASAIDLGTARRLGLRLGAAVRVQGVHTTQLGYWPVHFNLTPGRALVPSELLCIDLHELSANCEEVVDGLIGADFFRGSRVQIDFKKQKLVVGRVDLHDFDTECIPMEIGPMGFRIAMTVDGNVCSAVRVDTGCATPFQWVLPGVSAVGLPSKLAVGLSKISIPQTLTSLRVGHREMPNVPTGLHRRPIFRGESGLVGNGLLSRFETVTFDSKAGLLFLGRSADGGYIPVTKEF